MAFADTVATYLTEPSSEHWAELREQVVASDNYDWQLSPRSRAERWLAAGDHLGLIAELESAMPGGFTNPSLHLLLAEAHRQLGDTEATHREVVLYQAMMSGILATGDGTVTQPWSVLSIAEEYDALQALKKQSVEQSLIESDGRPLDRHRCSDGSEIWFAPQWLA